MPAFGAVGVCGPAPSSDLRGQPWALRILPLALSRAFRNHSKERVGTLCLPGTALDAGHRASGKRCLGPAFWDQTHSLERRQHGGVGARPDSFKVQQQAWSPHRGGDRAEVGEGDGPGRQRVGGTR